MGTLSRQNRRMPSSDCNNDNALEIAGSVTVLMLLQISASVTVIML